MKKVNAVFMVDDDPTNNLICRRMIEKSGFSDNVTCYTDTQEALNQLNSLKGSDDYPNILFLDINMPPTTGWEFLESFEEQGLANTLKVFMLSSGISPEEEEKARSYASVTGILNKPLSESKLQDISSTYL